MSIPPIAALSSARPPGSIADGPAPMRASAPLSTARLRQAPPEEQRAAVAAQFEAILIRQLLGKTMTSMLGAEGGVAAGVYGDLLVETLATQLAAGGGLGLGRILERQLAPRDAAASDFNLSHHP